MEKNNNTEHHHRKNNSSGGTKKPCKDSSLSEESCRELFFHPIGRLRPFWGAHSLLEAGGSAFLPVTVLLVYRLLCTCGFVFTLVLFTATGDFHFARYGEWVYLGSGLAMCCALFSSLCLLLFSELIRTERHCSALHVLANLAVLTFQIFFTLTVVGDVLFWSLLREPQPTVPKLLLYAGSAVVMLVDSVLASRMHFRISYIFLAVILPCVWLAFAWIRFAVLRSWMYEGLNPNDVGIARVVVLHVTLLTAPLLFGFILLSANRLQTHFLTPHIQEIVEKAMDFTSSSDIPVLRDENGVHMDLASIAVNSSSFISLSATFPMYQVSGREAVPEVRNQREHFSQMV